MSDNELQANIAWAGSITIIVVALVIGNATYYTHKMYYLTTNGYIQQPVPGSDSPIWVKEAK